MSKLIKWEELNNFQIEEMDKNKIVIIPIGSTEAHGKHLSMNTDNIIPQFLATELCKQTSSILGVPITIGNSSKLVDFPGTLSIRHEVFKEYLKDVFNSYHRAGFKKILILNGHFGNNNSITEAVSELSGIKIKYTDYKSLVINDLDESYKGRHSTRIEVEICLIAKPDSVDISKAKDHYIENDKFVKDKYPRSLMPDCVDGFPSKANAKDGKILVEKILLKLKNITEEMK